jgi:hypothetical protein
LHNKPQGCGASVASAAGPLKKLVNTQLERTWQVQVVAGIGRGRYRSWQVPVPVVAGTGRGRYRTWQVPVVAGTGRGRYRSWQVPVMAGTGTGRGRYRSWPLSGTSSVFTRFFTLQQTGPPCGTHKLSLWNPQVPYRKHGKSQRDTAVHSTRWLLTY